MSNFLQKRKFKRFLYSPVMLVPLAILVLFYSASVWDVYTKERETRMKRNKQAAQLDALEARASALRSEIDKLRTERGREAEIRNKFEVAKQDEHVIVIVDPDQKEEPAKAPPKPSFWQKVLNWF